MVEGTDLKPELIEHQHILSVVFGQQIFLVKQIVAVDVFREEGEAVEIDIAFDGAGDQQKERIDHRGRAEQQDQVDRRVQQLHPPMFPFHFSDDSHSQITSRQS